MVIFTNMISKANRMVSGLWGTGHSMKSAKPALSFDQAADLVSVGSDQANVDAVLGQPQLVTHRDSKEIRNYALKSGDQGSVEFFTGIFEAGRLIKTRHAVVSGNI